MKVGCQSGGTTVEELEFKARHGVFNIDGGASKYIPGVGWDNFEEVYPDNGDLDFFQILKILRDLDYPYLVMPDHVPHHADPASSRQAFSFSYGYIKGLLDAVSAV